MMSLFELSDRDARGQRLLNGLLWMSQTLGGRTSEVHSAGEAEINRGESSHDSKRLDGRGKSRTKLNSGPKPTRCTGTRRNGGRNRISRRDRERMEEGMEERIANGGFTDDELNELWLQGVKPWDDDAWNVLAALSC